MLSTSVFIVFGWFDSGPGEAWLSLHCNRVELAIQGDPPWQSGAPNVELYSAFSSPMIPFPLSQSVPLQKLNT